MSRWFRLYDETLNDPKILRLSDKTHRVWIGILCIASKNNGELPPFEDMAVMLRMKPVKLQPELESLITAGLIDHDDAGLRPHNWNGRQYKSDVSTERVKRFRNSKRNVSETPPDTEQNRDAEPAPKSAPVLIEETSEEKALFAKGRSVLGASAGGLIARLLKSKKGSVPQARAAIEIASTKQDAREYIGRIIAGSAEARDDFRNPLAGIQ